MNCCSPHLSWLITEHCLRITELRVLSQWLVFACAAAPGSRVRSFDTTVDLRLAVIVLFDSSIVVWDVATMAQACVLQSRGKRDAEFGHSSGVNDVAISKDGSTVVTVAKDETARVWDVESGAGQHVLRGGHLVPL